MDAAAFWATPAQAVPVLVGYTWFAVSSIFLTVIDVRSHRLPDRTVLPGYAVGLGCLVTASVVGVPWSRLLFGVIGMAALFLFYLALRAVSRRGLGGGDVKLAGLIGLHLGWLGVTPLLLGSIAAFVLGGLYAVALLATRRATRSTQIPFGPFMLAGAWIAIVLAGVRLAG